MGKNLDAVRKSRRMAKEYKGEWWSINSLLGNDWAIFYYLLGGRGVGKSYAAMKWASKQKIKLGDKCKFYWMRLTDAAVDMLLANGGDKLIDPDIKKDLGLKTMRKGNDVYTYEEEEVTKRDGTVEKRKVNQKLFCTVLSCSTFYNTKGVGYYSADEDLSYIFILDEMNREMNEKNSFDILYNFTNLLENLARFTKSKIKVICIGNTLDEASDLLTSLNFIPDDFGRYKLKSKRAVVDYIKPTEAHKKHRKGSVADLLMGSASTFTNEISIDRSLLVNKRKAVSPEYVIKFSKSPSDWFTVYNDNIIKAYNNEQKPAVAMRRYLDTQYNAEAVKRIYELFDARAYTFVDLACFKKFQKQLRLLKK